MHSAIPYWLKPDDAFMAKDTDGNDVLVTAVDHSQGHNEPSQLSPSFGIVLRGKDNERGTWGFTGRLLFVEETWKEDCGTHIVVGNVFGSIYMKQDNSVHLHLGEDESLYIAEDMCGIKLWLNTIERFTDFVAEWIDLKGHHEKRGWKLTTEAPYPNVDATEEVLAQLKEQNTKG